MGKIILRSEPVGKLTKKFKKLVNKLFIRFLRVSPIGKIMKF